MMDLQRAARKAVPMVDRKAEQMDALRVAK